MNAVVVSYLAACVVVGVVHALGHASLWLPVHVLLLGAVTNAIVIWSLHFATTLLRTRELRPRRLLPRLVALNVAVIGILFGVSAHMKALTVSAAALLTVVIMAHGGVLVRVTWAARANRFAVTVRFYWAATAALILGIAAGTAMTVGVPAPWYARVLAAHVQLNVFGWVALTVLGTEFSFWPMVLRTRMVGGVEIAARHALPLCAGGLAVAVAGLLIGNRPVAAVGLATYVVGVTRSLEPFVRTALQRSPHSPAAWMLAAATSWLLVALVIDCATVVRFADMGIVAGRIEQFVPWVLVGFVLQVLIGALTYLLPAMLGGGPAGVRRTAASLDRWGAIRFAVLNAGVALIALPLSAATTALGWWLIAAAVTAFVGLAVGTIVTVRARAELPSASP